VVLHSHRTHRTGAGVPDRSDHHLLCDLLPFKSFYGPSY
jgi:hypothetical protein